MNRIAIHFLALTLLVCLIAAEQKPMTCNQSLVESYGIISYMEPAKEKLLFCGSIKATCCPAFEQFKMYAEFKKSIQPNFITMNKLIVTELKLLKTEIDQLMKSKQLEQKIESHPEKVMKAKLLNEYQYISGKNITQIIDKMLTHQEVSSNYMSAIKSALICTVCDYTNQMFIDEKKKTITYNLDTCDILAKNTILYTYLLNRVLVPYLEKISYIIAKLRNSSKYQKLHNLGRIEKAIKDCQQEMLTSDTNTGLSGCKAYCSLFQANSENFVFEGYPELFANTLVDIRQFMKNMPSQFPDAPKKSLSSTTPATSQPQSGGNNAQPQANAPSGTNQPAPATGSPQPAPATGSPQPAPATPPKPSRKLRGYDKSPKTSSHNKHNHSWRVLAEINRRRKSQNLEAIHERLTERLLEASNDAGNPAKKDAINKDTDEFDYENLEQEIDIFDASSDDPNLTDAMLDDMMQIQNAFNSADKGDFQTLIKRFFVERYKPEIEDIDDDRVFKTASNERINLVNFKTEFGFAGIDLDGIINKMNWALDTKKIAMSLVGGEDEGAEVIDSQILDIVNSVGNNDVRKFHTDNFAEFLDVQSDSLGEAINKELKAAQILALEQQILEETAVYNYLIKNFKTESQANEIWEDLQKKKQDLTKLQRQVDLNLNTTIGTSGSEVSQESVALSEELLNSPKSANITETTSQVRKLRTHKGASKSHHKKKGHVSKRQAKRKRRAQKHHSKAKGAAKKASRRHKKQRKAKRAAKRAHRKH